MHRILLLGPLVLGLSFPAAAVAGELQLTIGGGRVTLIADAVPVRTILQEWARLGQSRIINGEKVMGAPVTLRLIDVPEEQALEIVLRSASGYLAAPRAVEMANASRFDRIVILATSRPTTTAAAPGPVQPQQPQPFPANTPVQAPIADDQEVTDEGGGEVPANVPQPQLPTTAGRPGPIEVTPPGGPQPMQPPMPGQQIPGQQPQPPMTSPRPGVIIQPQPPQQPQPPPARPIP